MANVKAQGMAHLWDIPCRYLFGVSIFRFKVSKIDLVFKYFPDFSGWNSNLR